MIRGHPVLACLGGYPKHLRVPPSRRPDPNVVIRTFACGHPVPVCSAGSMNDLGSGQSYVQPSEALVVFQFEFRLWGGKRKVGFLADRAGKAALRRTNGF